MEWFMIFCTFVGTLVCLALGSLFIGVLLVRKGRHTNNEYTAMVFIASWVVLLLACACFVTWRIIV